MCRVDLGYPPLFWPVWYVERAIYTESWRTIPQYTVSLSLSLVTHWFSLHYHLHHQHYHLPSSSYPWERVSWPFFKLSLCLFSDYDLWLSRVVFQLSLSLGPVSTWPSWEPSEWSQVWWPPWSWHSFECFGHFSRGEASHLTVPRTIWFE